MPKGELLLRKALCAYLQGDGIEIGALHRPLRLRGLPITRIRYVDRWPAERLREHYPELSRHRFIPIDVIDDGETLATFPDSSLDFIIANHFIEHARNPIGTIRNWLAKLKPGGVIYMAVPDMRHSFDSERPLTSLGHLLQDDLSSEGERAGSDFAHFLEHSRLAYKMPDELVESHSRKLLETGYSIHFHTFVPRTLMEMLRHAQEHLGLPLEIRAHADTPPGGTEFLFVLARTASN
jgi:SAM-dependent methyltransferase